MSDFLKNMQKVAGNKFSGVASEGIVGGDVAGYIDTGSYILNALVSGSIFGGVPSNKRTLFAGESTTGKTFFVLGILKTFLEQNPDHVVAFFESESAISKDMMESRGVDSSRVIVLPVATVEEFRTQATKILDDYMEQDEETRPKMVICLDSLGMLSTLKEVTDISEGNTTRDMTRAQLIRGAFRVITLRLGLANVPLLLTNHTYETIGMFSEKKMGGGSGAYFAGDNILFLSKKKEKSGTEVIGNIVHVLNKKSRLTVENKKVDVLITYKEGLDRYYGLIDLGIKYGVFKKVANKVELPDGSKAFAKVIYNNPKKYFTQEILEQLDECAKQEFVYGDEDDEETADES